MQPSSSYIIRKILFVSKLTIKTVIKFSGFSTFTIALYHKIGICQGVLKKIFIKFYIFSKKPRTKSACGVLLISYRLDKIVYI